MNIKRLQFTRGSRFFRQGNGHEKDWWRYFQEPGSVQQGRHSARWLVVRSWGLEVHPSFTSPQSSRHRGKILYLRRHYSFGAPNISMYLAGYHDLIDDCTQLHILKIYERNDRKNAIEVVDYILFTPAFPYADHLDRPNIRINFCKLLL